MDKVAIIAQDLNNANANIQYHIFDENGGTIGSSSTNNLCLQDSQIHEKHAKIQYEDGCFTISSIGDADIFYNDSFSKLNSGYETIMELGDTFNIGNYKCNIIDPKDLKDEFLDNKKIINEIDPYDKLDNAEIRPRGQINGLDIEEEKLEDILNDNKIFSDFMHNIQDTTKPREYSFQDNDTIKINTEDIIQHTPLTIKQILSILSNKLDNIRHVDIDLSDEVDHKLDASKLETIIANKPLLESTELINTALLSIIVKELYNPTLESIDDNILANVFNCAMIKNLQGDTTSLQYILVKALQSYLNSK